jgi:hypothetical protein
MLSRREFLATAAVIRAQDFGAIGDGNRDDTQSLQNALDRAIETGGTLSIPQGEYITGPLTVRRRDGMPTVSIIGAGSQLPLQVAGKAGTTLKYDGPVGGKLLHLYGINSGSFGSLNLDGSDLAEPLHIESSVGAEFKSITVLNAKGYGITLKGSDAGVYRNAFTLLRTHNCDGGILLTGLNKNVNVATNSFTRTDIGWRGPEAGLRLESADNNDFFGMSIVGTGTGMLMALCPPSPEWLGAVANRFYGLDGSAHVIVAEAHHTNTIFGLSHVNGIPGLGGTQYWRVQVIGEQ